MNKPLALLLLVSLFISSCAGSKVDKPTSISTVVGEAILTPADILFSFKHSNVSLADEDLEDKAQEDIKKIVGPANLKIKWIEDDNLNEEIAFKIAPAVDKGEQILVVRYAEDAFKDHSATFNLTKFMESFFTPGPLPQLSIFEIYNNAVISDPTAMLAVAKIRRVILTPADNSMTYYSLNTSQYNGFVAGESSLWEKRVTEYTKLEKKKLAEKRKPAQAKK